MFFFPFVGGKIKKTFLATVGMAAAAAVCYPQEATEISAMGLKGISDFVKETYRDNFSCQQLPILSIPEEGYRFK